MYHQDTAACYPVESRQRGNRLASAVHEIHWFLQAAVMARDTAAGDITLVTAFVMELSGVLTRDRIHKPEPGIMPGLFVLCSGITQPGNELYGSQWSSAG
jgi:hypothetical protein